MLKSFLNIFATKDLTNGIKPIDALRIQKHVLGVRKSKKSDMDESNPLWKPSYAFCWLNGKS
jgi:hypothetical protein